MSIREDLKAFVDGELSPERAREVEAVLEHDPDLRQEVEFMKSLAASFKALRKDTLVTGQAKAPDQPSKRLRLPLWAYAAGSLILLAGIGMLGSKILPSLGGGAASEAAAGAEMAESKMAMEPPVSAQPSESENYAAGKAMPTPDMEFPHPGKLKGGMIEEYSRKTMADEKTESGLKTASPAEGVDKGSAIGKREIIRRADLKVKVDSVSKRLGEATNMARTFGGYTESSNLNLDDPKRPTATMVLRLPSRNFETALEKLRGMGEVIGENLDGDDVTAEVMDVAARLKTLRSEEEQYRTILRKAWRIGDILDIKQRLGDVRSQIESFEAQQRFLKSETSLSTIGVNLTQNYSDQAGAAGSSWTDETFAHAKVILGTAWQFIAQGAIYVFVLAPIWLPIVFIFKWMQRRAATPSSSS